MDTFTTGIKGLAQQRLDAVLAMEKSSGELEKVKGERETVMKKENLVGKKYKKVTEKFINDTTDDETIEKEYDDLTEKVEALAKKKRKLERKIVMLKKQQKAQQSGDRREPLFVAAVYAAAMEFVASNAKEWYSKWEQPEEMPEKLEDLLGSNFPQFSLTPFTTTTSSEQEDMELGGEESGSDSSSSSSSDSDDDEEASGEGGESSDQNRIAVVPPPASQDDGDDPLDTPFDIPPPEETEVSMDIIGANSSLETYGASFSMDLAESIRATHSTGISPPSPSRKSKLAEMARQMNSI